MTDDEKLFKAGCDANSFCVHSAGYHACRYTKNHPSNQSAPHICEDGNYFSLNPNIDQKTVNAFLALFD